MGDYQDATGGASFVFNDTADLSHVTLDQDQAVQRQGRAMYNFSPKIVIVDEKLHSSLPLMNAVRCLGATLVPFDEAWIGMDVRDDGNTFYVTECFEGDVFERLCRKRGARIVAPPVVIKCALENMLLPVKARPLYCMIMDGLVLCFAGFKVKDDLACLADIVHRMGGSIRKDFSSKVTHLVALSTNGEKYRTAVSLDTHIMSVEWVHKCWELRNDPAVLATDELLQTELRLKAFSFSVLCFYGFLDADRQHMEEVAIHNNGRIAPAPDSPICTHLVINERTTRNPQLDLLSSKVIVVKSEWFWASIQMEACADEAMYLFEDDTEKTPGSSYDSDGALTSGGKRTPKTLSGSKANRRKRLRENLAQLASGGEADRDAPATSKRRSSDGPPRRSLSTSFLDATTDTSAPLADVTVRENFIVSPMMLPKEIITKLNPRQQTIMELYTTEKNYVGILNTIIKVFKEEIERPDQPGGPILEARETREIFGGIPPLYDVHVKIRNELAEITSNWSTDHQLVGAMFFKHMEELARFYPNFINYFEQTKEAITKSDREKPRFHAFLRLCQSKAECGRQTLTELLIRPVQRLPSVMLLLRDIKRRTDKNHPDFEHLDKAIAALEEVMTHINEDKRKAEGHQTMFEIVNDIENCPPSLLSAHRSFVRKLDVIEVAAELSGKGDPITLFVFSDTLEICKRRTKALNPKSPGVSVSSRGTGSSQQKPYKHLNLIPLSSIKRVVDICERPDCRNVFALVIKKIDDKERLYSFAINDSFCLLEEETTDKEEFLTCLSKTICTSTCRTDYETLLAAVESHVLNIDTTDLNSSKSLSRVASKFSRRVSRVFSLNMTPRTMKRAISSVTQIVSPMRRESSVYGLLPTTPSSSSIGVRALMQSNGDDVSLESDCYSEIVDQMSIGTPSMQRRRETLAGISFSDIQQEIGTPKLTGDDAVFATPRPVKPLPRSNTPAPAVAGTEKRWFGSSLRRDYSSHSLSSQKSKESDAKLRSSSSSSTSNLSKKGFKDIRL